MDREYSSNSYIYCTANFLRMQFRVLRMFHNYGRSREQSRPKRNVECAARGGREREINRRDSQRGLKLLLRSFSSRPRRRFRLS